MSVLSLESWSSRSCWKSCSRLLCSKRRPVGMVLEESVVVVVGAVDGWSVKVVVRSWQRTVVV